MIKSPFGSRLRAYRLGWHESERHGCYIRMSDMPNRNSLIELCPLDKVPKGRESKRSGYHRCWWDEPSILDMLEWLKPIRKVKAYIAVVVDDNGKIIQ